MRYLSLTSFLFVFWLVLSGHYSLPLLIAGAASTLVCVFTAWRIRIVDAEGHPVELLPGAVVYFPWLLGEILRSAWAVSKLILDPRLRISPTMTVILASQRTTVGLATFANSITLTPGTITVGQNGTQLTVHALEKEGTLELEGGKMDRRICRLEENL